MIVPKMNCFNHLKKKQQKKTCPAKQSIHFINENEKHINHGMSERAEEKQPKEKKEIWRPLQSGLAILHKFFMWNHVLLTYGQSKCWG